MTFFISSELLSMPAVKRFSVSFAKHPTNGTSASLQVYFLFLHLPYFACQWKILLFFHVITATVSFNLSSFISFFSIWPPPYSTITICDFLRTALTITQWLSVDRFTDGSVYGWMWARVCVSCDGMHKRAGGWVYYIKENESEPLLGNKPVIKPFPCWQLSLMLLRMLYTT